MTDQQIIIEVAKLDGWTVNEPNRSWPNPFYTQPALKILRTFEELPPYLISRDAIIPVIEKVINRHTCHSFFDALGLEAIKDWADCDGSPVYEGDGSYFELWVLFKASPHQLCIALLKTTGKFTEEINQQREV